MPAVNSEPVVSAEPMPVVNPEPVVSVEPNINTPSDQPYQPQQSENSKNKKKLIIGGVILGVILLIVLIFVLKGSGKNSYNDYGEQLKREEKEEEKLNSNFDTKGYTTQDGILVELNNKNSVAIDADYKIELLDESGNIVDVENGYMFDVGPNSVVYEEVYIDKDTKYSTYNITVKLEKSLNSTYVDKIELVSNNLSDDKYIVQIKNNADIKLQVEAGIFFIGSNNEIIDYDNIIFKDVMPGETSSEKVYIPRDKKGDYSSKIKYDRVDVKILIASND